MKLSIVRTNVHAAILDIQEFDMIFRGEKVRVEKIQELNFQEVQFLAFIKDGKTFPRKVVPKLYKDTENMGYVQTSVHREKDCLRVLFVNGHHPAYNVILSLRIFDEKIYLVNSKTGKFEIIHPSIEAFLDTLTYVQDMQGTQEEFDVIKKNLLDLKYDLTFGIGISTSPFVERINDLYILVGNIYARFTRSELCRYTYIAKLGNFCITCLQFVKVYDSNN